MKKQDIDIDIIKILKEIAHNEHEKLKTFRERIVEYCTNKKTPVFTLLRTVKGIEMVLSECLSGKQKVNVDRSIILKVLKTIRVEIEIIRCRMKHPTIFGDAPPKAPLPAGEWTSDKIDLIELIYAIQKSVNNGKVSIKALQQAFEYIFQVELGNIYDRISEINERKYEKATYLESLINNLHGILEKLS